MSKTTRKNLLQEKPIYNGNSTDYKASWSKVLGSLLSSNLKTFFSETRIKPSTRQATRSAASTHRSDPSRAWTQPTPQEVPLDSLQVKPGHQEKKLEVRESMKQYPGTPSQTPRRKHPKEPWR
ncbi:hypothetical protein F2Q69_00048439 [Brassica cretica]|uniref:Uncharacterized protein n=1 Tax=Brassica cretica TaxID=69181 RepID=A0A8S9PK61_BRACR|nr:hypothetical protein F2Q69_00048439 [Brassica cretica]